MKLEIINTEAGNHTTTLSDFLRDNPDLEPEEVDGLNDALAKGRTYVFGGGAAPEIRVRQATDSITESSKREMEQEVLVDLSDDLSLLGTVYEDRDDYGTIGFLVCADTAKARKVIDDTPAEIEVRGSSLIVTVEHP